MAVYMYFAMDILQQFLCYLAYASGTLSFCYFADNGT